MSYQGRDDALLTNLAVSYPMGNLIGTQVAPIRKVDKDGDSVFKDADDSGDQSSDLADGTPSTSITFDKGDKYSYKTQRHALNTVVLDKQVSNESQIINSLKRKSMKLVRRLYNSHEVSVATVMKNVAKITQYSTLTTTDQIDNASYAKNFITKYITKAKKQIRAETGNIANTIVIPYDVALYWAASGEISDKVMYAYGKEFIQGNIWAQNAFKVGLPPEIQGLRVVVSGTRINDANKGQTKSISDVWGKNIWIGYVADMKVEDTFGLVTMEYESFKVMKKREDDPKSTKAIVSWDYDIMEADLNTWYLCQNVIS